jgi:hypothetical protein
VEKICLKKRKLIILGFSITCLALILITGGFLYAQRQQRAEQRLQDYIKRLKDLGYNVEEHSLEDFGEIPRRELFTFEDFCASLQQENVSQVYFDRGIDALYFPHSSSEGTMEAVFFDYGA